MNKLVILVVDTSSSFAPLYNDLLNAYLNPLLARMFNEQTNQPQAISHEVGLVLFRDYTPDSEYLVKSSTFSSDFKEIRWSLNNLQFGPTSIFPARPLVEALCCATKMTRLKEAKEKHIIIVSNTPVATDIICHSCNELDNCFEHATRLKKEHIQLSVITGRQLEGIQELWESAKLDTKDHTPTLKTTSPYHTVLLRGLSITPIIPVANSPVIPTVQSTAPTVTVNPPTNIANNIIIEPKKEVIPQQSQQQPQTTQQSQQQPNPTGTTVQAAPTAPTTTAVKPIWEGTVTWPSTQSPAAPFCELIAYPASRDTDPASYGASEWPSKLEVTGVAPTKDPSIAPFYKTAKVIEFVPSKKGDQYRNLYQQLAQKSWAAVVYLQQKTLLILPHGATEKLVGLLLPKLSLTQQRSSPGNQPVPAPADPNKQAIHNKPGTIQVQNSPSTVTVTNMAALNANKIPQNTGTFPTGSIQNFTATQIKNFNGTIMPGQPTVTVTGNGMQPMQHTANFRGFMQGNGNVNVNNMNPMLLQQLQQQQQQQQLRGAQQQGNQPTQHFSL